MSSIIRTNADRPDPSCKCASCGHVVQHGDEIYLDQSTDQSRHTSCVPLPLVHLNGSGKARLVEQQRAVYDAARALLEALAESAPNQRDYYPLGDDVYRDARKAHDERLRHALRIKDDAMFTHMFLEDV